MNRSNRFIAIIISSSILLSGCNILINNNAKEVYSEAVSENQVSDNDISVSNNIVSTNKIILSNLGYEKKSPKRAIIRGESIADEFQIVDAANEKVVYEGSVIKWENDISDEEIAYCDFTQVYTLGDYYIHLSNDSNSEQFSIENGLIDLVLKERIGNFSKVIPKNYSKSTIGKAYMRISDEILAYELFEGSFDTGEEAIPQTVELAYREIDVLKNYIEDDGKIKSTIYNDLGNQYQYAAVFALFAENYSQYDSNYANECRKIAESALSFAESEYEALNSKEKEAISDKRYWAMAQMYKLSGENRYRVETEKYIDDVPSGFSEEKSGYLGTIAYLTCNHKVDVSISRELMESLMNDAISLSEESLESEYFVICNGDYNDETVINAFSNARLFVLANYISMSIQYIRGAENQIEYIYGRNPNQEDYAYSIDASYYDEPQAFILAGLIDSYIYKDIK